MLLDRVGCLWTCRSRRAEGERGVAGRIPSKRKANSDLEVHLQWAPFPEQALQLSSFQYSAPQTGKEGGCREGSCESWAALQGQKELQWTVLEHCKLAAQLPSASTTLLLSSSALLWLQEGYSHSLQLPPQTDSLSGRLPARVPAVPGAQPLLRRI